MSMFTHKDQSYPSDKVTAVKQKSVNTVEVRYLDGSARLLRDTTASEILSKIEAAKSGTDSA